MNYTEAQERSILVGYRGSIAHGTFVPNSDPTGVDDKDTMGVFISPPEHYLGLPLAPQRKGTATVSRRDTVEYKEGEVDAVYYDIRKFFKLLLQNNPNVMSLLWLREQHYQKVDPYGLMILQNRDIFLSRQAHHAFTGYAHDQLRRMTSAQLYEGYMGAKRKALVDRFGYDTKNAAHLIRLLKMGIEYLTEGRLHVTRHDAGMLVAIKRGEWSLERVQKEAERLFVQSTEAYIRSTLPDSPDYEAAEALLMSIQLAKLREKHL